MIYSRLIALAAFVCAFTVPFAADAQEEAAPKPKQAEASDDGLRFAFEGTPWRDVIEWLAEESDLALHIGDLPTGSLTYTDPRVFTQQEAIDRVNLFLLPQGYTLVRSGRLLSVINLTDPRSVQQLDTLARLVRVEELEKLDSHQVVKCFFPLGDIEPEDAVQELSPLNLMTQPAIFARSNQLLITETAGKLRNVVQILDRFQPGLDNGTVMKNFALQHVDAEDILTVARPHLGLATGEMIGIDVSLSSDPQNKNIFVTGVEDKVKLIENLVEALDKPKPSLSAGQGGMVLRSYTVAGGNVEVIYNVLQTLLAGKEVRLSMDEQAGAVVALATPETQQEIAATVEQLQAASAEFEVIPLKYVDPYLAVSLLEQLLDLPGPLDEPEDIDPDAPKIDADPDNMRLFVRGKQHAIDQVKKIVEGLDKPTGASQGETVRLLPLQGRQAELVLETAARFWRGGNPIILIGSSPATAPSRERSIHGENDSPSDERQRSAGGARTNTTRVLNRTSDKGASDNGASDNKAAAILCQLTLRGLLIQCEDSATLERFEQHLRTIAGPLDSLPSPPVVFYLKYMRPDDALRMLAELLDGGESVSDGDSGSLVNGYVASGGGSILGSIVTNRDGMTTLMAGSITVVADSRLNRLIAQGSAAEIDQIESYLKIIDKDASITDIETFGRSHIIELKHTKASEVAATLRDAYAGRLSTGNATPQAAGGKGQPQQPQGKPQAAEPLTRAPAGGNERPAAGGKKQTPQRGAAAARDLTPKMTIAVHEASNSLIVTAPESLFREVEQLAKLIDSRGRRATEVIGPIHSEAVESLLQEVFGGGGNARPSSRTSTSRTSSPRPSSTRPPSTPSTSFPAGFRGKPVR